MGDVEKKLHRIFSKDRKKGEWFSLTDEQIQAAIVFIENEP
jgi:hypothetical protein